MFDNTKVKGDYQDGILVLELPKAEEEKHKVTRVNLGSGENKTISAATQTNGQTAAQTSESSASVS